MHQKAKEFIKHPLIYGSSIVVIGGLIANFFNFLFNLFMSRNLSVADYGTLASIVSLIGFPTLIVSAVVPLVIRFAGDYFAQNKLDLVRGLYVKIIKFFFALGIMIFLLFIVLMPNLGNFFHIDNKIILILTDFMIFLAIIGILNIALLQAKLAFGYQVFLSFLGAVIKLLLGILFVFMGFSVTGAIVAMAVGGFGMYIASFFPIRFIFDKKIVASPSIDTKELFAYGIPSAIALFGLTSLISTDVILVKHFFDPKSAGIYAGLSLIGRVIFYISAPIGGVMFPIIVQKHSKNESFSSTFNLSLFLVFIPSLLITTFYSIFPKFSILFFLKKSEYLSASPLLGLFGLFISLYCLLFIISNFYLSIKKTNIYIPILLGAVMQIFFIFLFHSTFLQVVSISLAITFLLTLTLLLYYPHATKKRL